MYDFRKNYSIWLDIKNKRYHQILHKIKIIFFIPRIKDRNLIIYDSFIRPFYKKIGCRFFGHKWFKDGHIGWGPEYITIYYCRKCHKCESEGEWKSNQRIEKIKKLIS